MNYKLHIDVSKGLIEAEGDKDFVMHVYNDFKDSVANNRDAMPAKVISPTTSLMHQENSIPASQVTTSSPKSTIKAKTPKAKPSRGSVPALNNDLNLYAEGNQPSLKDFMNGYSATSNQAIVLLFVHYLKEIKGVQKVGVSEIYTCYKHMGFKVPSIFDCLKDVARHKGWLNATSADDVHLTIAGENAVSHDLPKKAEAA